jgi:hypothetical protein
MVELIKIQELMNKLILFESVTLNYDNIHKHLNNFKIELFKLIAQLKTGKIFNDNEKLDYLNNFKCYKFIVECQINIRFIEISEKYDDNFNDILNKFQFIMKIIIIKIEKYINK